MKSNFVEKNTGLIIDFFGKKDNGKRIADKRIVCYDTYIAKKDQN